MAVHFLVIAGYNQESRPFVSCLSDGRCDYLPSSYPRTLSNPPVLHEVVVDATPPMDPTCSCPNFAPAVEAIAKLDEANFGSRDPFHRAMAKIFEMGMAAQRDLDQKARDEQGRKALEQFEKTLPQVVPVEPGQSDEKMGLEQESHSG